MKKNIGKSIDTNIPNAEIIFFEKLKQMKDVIVIMTDLNSKKAKEIYTEVICNRIAPHLSKKKFEEMYEDNEYFNVDLVDIEPKTTTIVDCGAYKGDSLDKYMLLFNNEVKEYICF